RGAAACRPQRARVPTRSRSPAGRAPRRASRPLRAARTGGATTTSTPGSRAATGRRGRRRTRPRRRGTTARWPRASGAGPRGGRGRPSALLAAPHDHREAGLAGDVAGAGVLPLGLGDVELHHPGGTLLLVHVGAAGHALEDVAHVGPLEVLEG